MIEIAHQVSRALVDLSKSWPYPKAVPAAEAGRMLWLKGYDPFACNIAVAIGLGRRVALTEVGPALMVMGAPFPGGVDEWDNDNDPAGEAA